MTHKIGRRLVLCYHKKPDSNRRHNQNRSLRSCTLYERKTHHYSFIIADDVETLTPNHFLLGRAHASTPPLQTQHPSILSRQWKFAQHSNPYLEELDQEVYPNITATTTMDKEDATYKNRNCLDSSGYDATRTLANFTDHRKQINR